MNIPYVKQYDKNGNVANPIKKTGYINEFPNRRQRRADKNQPPFVGNGHQYPLDVHGTAKYLRHIQVEWDQKEGRIKRIKHYLIQK